jgi:hypothetical protein
MLKSGDANMKPMFDFNLNDTTQGRNGTRTYRNHAERCFHEQLENFGLPNLLNSDESRLISTKE